VESEWWQPALSCVEVPSVELPRILEIGEPAGRLHPELAEKWHIPPVPVVAGANDQTTAALGAGLSRPEEVNLGLGTAIVAYQVVASEAPRPGSRPLRGPYVGGLDYQLTLHNTAGGVIEWARNLFADQTDWERFFDVALSAEPGAGGLRLDPGFSTASGGKLARLSLHHAKSHILRAVLEGVACAARQKLDELDAPEQCFATGAASANDRWMQMMADVTGRTIRALAQPQATLWGTALAAGAGAGVFEDILQAAREYRSVRGQFEPNPELQDAYDDVYADYRNIGGKFD
jgi:xylulokinase